MFVRRAKAADTVVGGVASILVLLLVQQMKTPVVHGYLYAAVGILTWVIVGSASSILLGGATKAADGLTLRTLKKQ